MHKPHWQWRQSVESPWFYAASFCLFAAAMLLVAYGKYGERQAGIERRFQARSQPLLQSEESPGATASAEHVEDLYSTPEDTVISLWPLAAVLGGLACVAAALAVRAGFAQKRK